MSKTLHTFGALTVNGLTTLNKINVSKSTVSQSTSITSGVTLDTQSGIITSVTSTLATFGNASFTVTNNSVSTDSLVLGNIVNYSGSNGIPTARIQAITSGSFTVTLSNASGTSALNGTVKIGYLVL